MNGEKITVGQLVYKISGDMENLKTQLNKTEAEVSKLKSTMDKGAKSSDGMTKSFGNLQKIILGLASIQGVKALIGQVIDLGTKAAEVESLRTSFDRLATSTGQNSEEILSKLRELSQGTIATKDLILSANRAMVLGVAKDTEEFGQLMQIARLRARDMGITTTQAFNDIVTGIGRGSPLILDNLGIIVKQEQAYKDYAAQLGVTTEQLTDNQRAEALKKAVLESGNKAVAEAGDLALSSSERIQKMQVRVEELRIEIGEKLLPTLLKVFDTLSDYIDTFSNAGEATRVYQREIDVLNGKMAKLDEQQQKLIDGKAELTQADIDGAKASLDMSKQIANQQRLVSLLAEADQLGAKRKEARNTLEKEYNDVLEKTLGITDFRSKTLQKMYEEQLDKLSELQIAYVKTGRQGVEPLNDLLEENAKKLREASAAEEKKAAALEASKQAAEEAQKKLESFQETLLGLVENAKKAKEALENDLANSFNKFADSLKGNVQESVSSLATIIVNAETELAKLRKDLAAEEDPERRTDIQAQIAEQEKIIASRAGFEERQAQRIAEIRKKLEDAGIDAAKAGLDNLITVKTLEQEIEDQRKLASLDEFARFEELQSRKLISLTDALIKEVALIKTKIDTQEQYEAELTLYLASEESKRLKNTDAWAKATIDKYKEVAASLQNLLSLKARLGDNTTAAAAIQASAASTATPETTPSSTVNNSKTINAPVTINAQGANTAVDYRTISREMGFEISRL